MKYKQTLNTVLVFIICIISITSTISVSDCFSQHRFKTIRDTTKYNEQNLDIKLFRKFNNIKSSFLKSVVNITNESVIPLSVILPAGLYIYARAENNYNDEDAATLLALSEVTNLSVTQALKYIVKRNRPFRTLNNVNLYDTSTVENTYSFPSGHTSQSFAIATSLTLSYPDKPFLITGLYTYSLIVSLGRIYWGVHYPSDVLSGMLIGAGSAALIYSLRKPLIQTKNNLFNQKDRNNSYHNNINSALVLFSVIGTDAVNFFFLNSKNSVLKKSRVNIMSSGSNNFLNFNFNF